MSTSKRAQFKVVKDLLTKADTIIVATDSGREGSNIAWSIMSQAQIDVKKKTIKRLWLNSLEKDAIITGFKILVIGTKTIWLIKKPKPAKLAIG
ncbi:DNA topoisomerase 3 (plasmid) [Lactiplantibacillus plantarum]|nr:DNA topoisomerase 3 [Lactiplantibacillus plantarum]